MAPPAPSEPPPDEETPFASWDEFGRPLSDETNPPASGFSQGIHEHNITAHNTTLGGAAEAHRQPMAASGTREPPAHGLGAQPSSFSTPSYVTRASIELDAAVPSLPTFLPTHQCRHTSNSDSHVSDGALRFDNLSGDASASRLPPPPPPSCGFGAATSPATDPFHRMATPQPHPDRHVSPAGW
ncbi:hypothetical protein AB1Y20_013162 [Prymnesium parvum]|uniref:Uncharacterized protein n=1 Tax=Prymnesium parvum TaxID=97485 RepID=A0AB34IKG0_PRYPA